MIFLVQFAINKHSQTFQTTNCTRPTGSCKFFVVFEKFARAYLFQIVHEIIWLPILINSLAAWNQILHF